MLKNKTIRNILLLWLAWLVILPGYQFWATSRMLPQRPDYARQWTISWTTADAQAGKPYLLEPFMNNQVSWDSEFYLSVAVAGYDDPLVTRANVKDQQIPLSYAFFPFYPAMIWLFSWPLKLLALTPIATATLAAVMVSMLGTLGGMLSLYFLAKDELDEAGGWRAAFYLIAFPSGFFLAMVYTEGLFVGLAFSTLALLVKRKWFWAGLLACCAALTRSVGVALVIPMGIIFLRDLDTKSIKRNLTWHTFSRVLLTLAPLVVFLIWKFSQLGQTFDVIQQAWFGRGFLDFERSFGSWKYAWEMVSSDNLQSAAYHLMEMVFPILALIACGFTLRRFPEITIFSLAVILFALFSGDIQGMYRYILAAPSVFLFLSRLGKNPSFDRVWSLASLLLLGINAFLFATDMWAG